VNPTLSLRYSLGFLGLPSPPHTEEVFPFPSMSNSFLANKCACEREIAGACVRLDGLSLPDIPLSNHLRNSFFHLPDVDGRRVKLIDVSRRFF